MPRQPRFEIPGIPMHVTQRGVNRCAIFIGDHDRRSFLDLLGRKLKADEVALHAYALMDNHYHLLLSASERGRVSHALSACNQVYVQDFNRRHGRIGTLWQGRFKSCLVDSSTYLLRVMRYIDSNPVRASLCPRAEDFAWSSARAHLGLATDPLLTIHPVFEALAPTAEKRASTYRAWLEQPTSDEERAEIRSYLAQQRALGEPRFQALVEKTLNRPGVYRPPGRPRESGSENP